MNTARTLRRSIEEISIRRADGNIRTAIALQRCHLSLQTERVRPSHQIHR